VEATVIQDEEFVSFLRDHHASLYRTAYLLTGTDDRAEELLQDTVVRLYPRWDRVCRADSPAAYVRRALINAFISGRRRPASRVLPLVAEHEQVCGSDPFAALDDRSALWPLLLSLPERQRAALVLRFYVDLPDAEIAASLGCREVTVRSLVSRGLATLRRQQAHLSPTPDSGGPA
jgi:RNA polymerase sigma-70 factor (sigma-E family)